MDRYGNPLPPWGSSRSHFHVVEGKKSNFPENKVNAEQEKLTNDSSEFVQFLDGLVEDADKIDDDDSVDAVDDFDDDGVDDTDNFDIADSSDLFRDKGQQMLSSNSYPGSLGDISNQHIPLPDIDPRLYATTNDQHDLDQNIDPALYGDGDNDQYVSDHPGRFGEADLHPPTSENLINGHESYDTDTKLLPPPPPAEMSLSFVESLISEVEKACGPLPDLSSGK